MVNVIAQLLSLQFIYALNVRGADSPEGRWRDIEELTQLREIIMAGLSEPDPCGHEAWNVIRSTTERYLAEQGAAANGNDLWAIARPVVLQTLPTFEATERMKVAGSLAGFTFEYLPVYFSEDSHPCLTLHFRNAFSPDSPFVHMAELRQGLLKIVRLTQARRPDISLVQCASWLNETRTFPSLFPEEWLAGSSRVPVAGNLGWWGQFVDRKSEFNEKLAEQFREKWEFPFHNRHCRCSLIALHNHLVNAVT